MSKKVKKEIKKQVNKKVLSYEFDADVIFEIFKYLKQREKLSISLVSKSCNKIYKYMVSGASKFQTIILRYNQYLAICAIVQLLKTSNRCVFNALPGYGKTITAIDIVYKEMPDKNSGIAVPSHTLKVWIDEFTRLKLYDANPTKSQVLVLHGSRPAHYKNYKGVKNFDDIFKDHRVFITTPEILRKYGGTVQLLIVDESQRIEKFTVRCPRQKTILLTGSCPNSLDVQLGNVVYSGYINKEILPIVKYKYRVIEVDRTSKGNRRDQIEDIKSNTEQYKKFIVRSIKNNTKPCIMVDGGIIGREITTIIKDNFPDYKIFELKGSSRVVDQHQKYEKKSVLIISITNCEGLNIFFNNLIILKSDTICSTRLNQAIARCVRPPNPNKKITVTFITSGRLGFLKTLYTVCNREAGWPFKIEESPGVESLFKSDTIAKLIGHELDFDDLINYVDLSIIFDNIKGEKRYKEVIDWWKNNRTPDTKLSKTIIKKMYL
jgi:hypothetical protein